jgi:hypothetical protein
MIACQDGRVLTCSEGTRSIKTFAFIIGQLGGKLRGLSRGKNGASRLRRHSACRGDRARTSNLQNEERTQARGGEQYLKQTVWPRLHAALRGWIHGDLGGSFVQPPGCQFRVAGQVASAPQPEPTGDEEGQADDEEGFGHVVEVVVEQTDDNRRNDIPERVGNGVERSGPEVEEVGRGFMDLLRMALEWIEQMHGPENEEDNAQDHE